MTETTPTIHPELEHARLGPSSAASWTLCPLYPKMQESYPDTAGEAAELGTAAHELLELCINDGNDATYYMGSHLNIDNPLPDFPDGFEVDQNMVDAVQMALDHLRERLAALLEQDPDTHIISERRVNPGLWMGRDDVWGTADITIIAPNMGHIEVFDYKNGALFVPVDNNPQLILYLIGVLADLPPATLLNVQTLIIGIIQPRCFQQGEAPIREQEIVYSSIPEWVSFFQAWAALSDMDDPEATPGEKQCRFCVGRQQGRCAAVGNLVIDRLCGGVETPPTEQPAELVAETVSNVSIKDADSFPTSHLIMLLDNAELIRGFLTAIEAHVTATLKNCTADDDIAAAYKLVAGKKGARKWSLDEEAMRKKLMNIGLKQAEYLNMKVKSATQIMNNAKGLGLTEGKIKNLQKLIVIPKGKATLVPVSDSRPSLIQNADEMFNENNLNQSSLEQ